MSVALVKQSTAIERTETGLLLPEGLPETAWRSIGEDLGRDHRASAWWIGDWVNYGEGAGFIAREKYEQAETLTGLARKTLRNYASVARTYKVSLRKDTLTFTHHATVAALPSKARESALAEASKARWSVAELASYTRSRPARPRANITPTRRHESFIAAADVLVKIGVKWESDMCAALSPPLARKQLTVLKKAAAQLAEVIEAVEYRAATPYQFMGR